MSFIKTHNIEPLKCNVANANNDFWDQYNEDHRNQALNLMRSGHNKP